MLAKASCAVDEAFNKGNLDVPVAFVVGIPETFPLVIFQNDVYYNRR
jgi:hypothetical protein